MRTRSAALVCLVTCFVGGCSDPGAVPELNTPVQPATNAGGNNNFPRVDLALPKLTSSKPRDALSSALDSPRDAMVRESEIFANVFFRQWNQSSGNASKNFVFSPLSVSMAFGMLYAGANGNTAAQIKGAMRWTQDNRQIYGAFNAIETMAENVPTQGATIQIENALFLDKRQTALNTFLDTLATHYGSGVYQMDTSNTQSAEIDRKAINNWIAGLTNGKIRDMLEAGSLNGVRFLLSNTIYFKGQWQEPFPPGLTTNQPFYLADGSTVSVAMMKGEQRIAVNRSTDYTAIELPFTGGNASVSLILPNESRFSVVEQKLMSDSPLNVLQNAQQEYLYIELPKFSFGTNANLIDILSQIGMTDVFVDGVADLSGIDGTRALHIGLALHAASISVDEKGTEAAAATVIGGPTSSPSQTLRFDRPFFFQIREKSTGALLFMGRLMNPQG